MLPVDLLNIDLMNKIDNEYTSKKIKKLHFQQVKRTYRPRLGKDYWRQLFKSKKRAKKLENKARKNRERRYKNRIPKKYTVYIISKWWDERKNRYFQKYGKRCEVCGHSKHVQVHHKLYKNYGTEKDEHLVALCRFHHSQLHLGIGKIKKDMIAITNSLVAEMKQMPFPDDITNKGLPGNEQTSV